MARSAVERWNCPRSARLYLRPRSSPSVRCDLTRQQIAGCFVRTAYCHGMCQTTMQRPLRLLWVPEQGLVQHHVPNNLLGNASVAVVQGDPAGVTRMPNTLDTPAEISVQHFSRSFDGHIAKACCPTFRLVHGAWTLAFSGHVCPILTIVHATWTMPINGQDHPSTQRHHTSCSHAGSAEAWSGGASGYR